MDQIAALQAEIDALRHDKATLQEAVRHTGWYSPTGNCWHPHWNHHARNSCVCTLRIF